MFGLSQVKLSPKYLEEFVTEYGTVPLEQVIQLIKNAGSETVRKKIFISHLTKYSTVVYDKSQRLFFSNNFVERSTQREAAMEKAMWVLIDFITRIDLHFPLSKDFSPGLICMMLKNRAYEIVYVSQGMEQYLDNQLFAARTELLYRADSTYFSEIVSQDDKKTLSATRYIVVMDDISKASLIKSPQVAYYCALDPEDGRTPIYYSAKDIAGGILDGK